MHVYANVMVCHISFSHVSLKIIKEISKFDKEMCFQFNSIQFIFYALNNKYIQKGDNYKAGS